jgi:hypothetical protein
MSPRKKRIPIRDIDRVFPGLGRGEGRNRDRFRVSSETRDPRLFDARDELVRRLYEKNQLDALRGRLDRRYSLAQLEVAWENKNPAEFTQWVRDHDGDTLEQLVERYVAQYPKKGKDKVRSHLERYLDYVGRTKKVTAFTSESVTLFLRDLTALNYTTMIHPAHGRTKNRYRAALSGFASFLMRNHLILHHIVHFKAVEKLDEGSARRLPQMSSEEFREALNR